jgi:hypothetical protein
MVLARPDMTVTEHWQELAKLGIEVRRSSVGRFLQRLQLTYKKPLHEAEQPRPDVKATRIAWREEQDSLDPRTLAFIDETWTSTNMTPRFGSCEKGNRLVAHAPFGHWKTTTFTAALRRDELTAPCVFDDPINGEQFRDYVG